MEPQILPEVSIQIQFGESVLSNGGSPPHQRSLFSLDIVQRFWQATVIHRTW